VPASPRYTPRRNGSCCIFFMRSRRPTVVVLPLWSGMCHAPHDIVVVTVENDGLLRAAARRTTLPCTAFLFQEPAPRIGPRGFRTDTWRFLSSRLRRRARAFAGVARSPALSLYNTGVTRVVFFDSLGLSAFVRSRPLVFFGFPLSSFHPAPPVKGSAAQRIGIRKKLR
jgi:hypothetical protein